jgi:hypothetical protein
VQYGSGMKTSSCTIEVAVHGRQLDR